jgi:predicted O-methyltransferase YrrM
MNEEELVMAELQQMNVFDLSPWKARDGVVSERPYGLLAEEEASMLYYLSRDFYSGSGEIVDAGAFLGTSSFCLAKGLMANPAVKSKYKRVHAYDAFKPWKEPAGSVDDTIRMLEKDFNVTLVDGSFLNDFLKNIEAYRDAIHVVEGDFLSASFSGGIEILFVDICKNIKIQSHLLREFYKKLMPGGVVIHQDYHHALLPWIHVVQERLSDYFEIIVNKASYSAVFMLTRQIPEAVIDECASYGYTVDEQISLIDSAIRRLPEDDMRDVEMAKAVLLINHGRYDEAEEIYERNQKYLEGGLDHQLQTNVWAYEWHKMCLSKVGSEAFTV